jgi:hypothetical protein
MKIFKLLDETGSLDCLRVTFYLSIVSWVISLFVITPIYAFGLMALSASILISVRDDIIKQKKKPIDDLNEKFALMQSDLTALKFNNLR